MNWENRAKATMTSLKELGHAKYNKIAVDPFISTTKVWNGDTFLESKTSDFWIFQAPPLMGMNWLRLTC